MTTTDAVVYDLDGTLVRLPVDWDAARRSVVGVFAESGVDPGEASLWELLERSETHGLRDAVDTAIARHEREAAHSAERLPTADDLVSRTEPTAVVSLNAEAACRIALDRHDLDGHVQAVIGRDSVATYKPDPAPLLAAARTLAADPERVLFIGDSERDEETARRAGTQFAYVEEESTGH